MNGHLVVKGSSRGFETAIEPTPTKISPAENAPLARSITSRKGLWKHAEEAQAIAKAAMPDPAADPESRSTRKRMHPDRSLAELASLIKSKRI